MTDHQQAAVEAGADRLLWKFEDLPHGTRGQVAPYVTETHREWAEDIITAAEPHLRKKVRAEVAVEIRASLPRDLAASAQDLDGWFSGMTGDLNIVVEVDEDMTPVGYGFELEAATGTIDLHHLADIAARIAEGAGE